MTKFKELRRIEQAIENRDESDLRWALGYCEMRLEIAKLKSHEKHWTKIRSSVQKALAEAESTG